MGLSIHDAARNGDLETLRRLLDKGVPVDALEDGTGYTPLMAACDSEEGRLACVELLLARGADPNVVPDVPSDRTAEAVTALALAVRRAPLEVVEHLIAASADVGFRTGHGYTLMTYAAVARRGDVLRALREAGAPLDGVSEWGESALSVLSREAEFALVDELLDAGADPAPLGWTRLHGAVAIGSLAEIA